MTDDEHAVAFALGKDVGERTGRPMQVLPPGLSTTGESPIGFEGGGPIEQVDYIRPRQAVGDAVILLPKVRCYREIYV